MSTARIRDTLTNYGMQYKEALERFADNESLLLSFVMEFPDEPYMADIKAARERGDAVAFAKAVHTLKGTSGSLAFIPLYQPCVELMAALRSQNGAATEPLYEKVCAEYDRLCLLLKELRA